MSIDCLDSIGDIVLNELDDDEDLKTFLKTTTLWNGRELGQITHILERNFLIAIIHALANEPAFLDALDEHEYDLLDLDEEEFVFESGLPVPYPEHADPDHLQCSDTPFHNGVSGIGKKIKKCAKKAVKQAAKSAKKVAEFVKEHKKEILIAVAVIAVATVATVAVATLLSASTANTTGAALAGALAASASGSGSKRREEEDTPIVESADSSPVVDTKFSSYPPITLDALDPYTKLFAANTFTQNPSAVEYSGPVPPELKYAWPVQYPEYYIKSGLETVWDSIKGIGNYIAVPELQDPTLPVDTFFSQEELQRFQSLNGELSSNAFQYVTNALKNGISTIGNSALAPQFSDPTVPVNFFLHQTELERQTDTAYSSENLQFPAYRNFLKKSECYSTEGVRENDKKITFINGINNSFDEAIASANHIRNIGETNLRVDGVYNKSHSAAIDLVECLTLNYLGVSPVTKTLLTEEWTQFHKDNLDNPNAKILHFCHSQGAIHTCNTLVDLEREIADRVIVVAIAPAMVVPTEWCWKSFNYASEKDLVHLAQNVMATSFLDLDLPTHRMLFEEFINNKEQLNILSAHENASGIDHEFISETYWEKIEEHIKEYQAQYGK